MRKAFNSIIKFSIYGLVLLMPLFWLPWTNEVYEFNKQYLFVFLVAIALMAWLAKMILVQKKIVFKRTPLDIWILVFMIVMILSAVFSKDGISSWLGFYGRFSDSVIGFLALGMMYFVVVNNMRIKSVKSGIVPLAASSDENAVSIGTVPSTKLKVDMPLKIKGMLKIFLASTGIVILLTYFSIFGLWNKISGLPQLMKLPTFNPISASLEGLSIFLATVIGLIAGMILIKTKNQKAKIKSKINSIDIFYYGLILASLFLIIAIDFRPAWTVLGITMSILLAIAFWTRLFRKRVNLLLWPIILLVLAAVCWTTNLEQGLVSNVLGIEPLPKEIILDSQTASSITWQTVKEKPVLGSGPGTFLADFTKFKDVEFNQNMFWNIRFDKAPSQLLEIVGTSGALGILSYLAIIVIFLLVVFISLRKMRDIVLKRSSGVADENATEPLSLDNNLLALAKGDGKLLFLPFLLAWLALLIGQIVYLGNTVILFYFWLFLALGILAWQQIQTKPVRQITFSFKRLPEVGLVMNVLLLILVFALVALFFLGSRFYAADVLFVKQGTIGGEQSIKTLERAVNLNKHREVYRRALSQTYLVGAWTEARKPTAEQNIQLLQAYASGSIQQARLASSLSPNLVGSWENLGIIYRDARGLVGGTLPFALDSFNRAIELEPTNPFFYRELCRINLILEDKDLDETLGYCQKAIDLKQNYLDAHIQLALVYERKGDLQAAVKQMEGVLGKLKGVSFQRGSTLAGAATEIYFQLGRLYFNLNQIDQAVKMFEQAVIVTPGYANARYGLAVAYQIKGRLGDALIQFQIINQLVGGNAEVEARIGQLQGQLAPSAPIE